MEKGHFDDVVFLFGLCSLHTLATSHSNTHQLLFLQTVYWGPQGKELKDKVVEARRRYKLCVESMFVMGGPLSGVRSG